LQSYPELAQAVGTVIVLIAAVPVTWCTGKVGAIVDAETIAVLCASK
jgi:hypothetical protein